MRRKANLGRLLYGIGVVFITVACAAPGTQRIQDRSYAQEAKRGLVQLYWNCERPAPDLVVVDGYAISPYTGPIQDLKFRLEGVDAKQAPVSQVTGAAKSHMIALMQPEPFRLELRTQGTEVRLNLAYTYTAKESSGGQTDTGGPIEHNMVARNACPDLK